MEDNEIEINGKKILIPILHRGKEFAVGFNDLGSIQPLETLLSQYFPKKYGKNIDNNVKELSSNIKKLISLEEIKEKTNQQGIKNNAKALQEISKALDKINETNQKRDNEEDTKIQSLIANLIKHTSIIASDIFKKSIDKMGFLVDLTKSGVTVVQGFNTLEKESIRLSRSQEHLTSLYSKNSQTIQRLNARMGDGVKTFNDALETISGKYALSAEEEEKIVANWYDDRMKYATTDELLNNQQISEMVKYTNTLIKLRTATGKNIDTILEETKLRDDELAYSRLMLNPKYKALASALSGMNLSKTEIKNLITGDMSTEAGIGINTSQFGQMFQNFMQFYDNPNYKGDLVQDLNKIYDLSNEERNSIKNMLGKNRQYSWLMKDAAYQNARNATAKMTRLNTTDLPTIDENAYTTARRHKDLKEKYKALDFALQTQSIENITKELSVINKGIDLYNSGLLKLFDIKNSTTKNYWLEAGALLTYGLGKKALKHGLQTVASMVVNATKVIIKNNNDKNSDKDSDNKESSSTFKKLLYGFLAYKTIGKFIPVLARLAGVGYEGYSTYKNIREGNNIDATSSALKTFLWARNPLLGMAGEGADIAGNAAGKFIANTKLSLAGKKTMTAEERAALMRKNDELFKQRQQFLQSQNVVPPVQPSFNSNSSTLNNQTSLYNEAQHYNNSNNIQKDIKELNSLMLDALERIEKGQMRQTQQLENIGFVVREKNTGVI